MSDTSIELAQKMSDYVNTFSFREKNNDFIKAFCSQHRTLQQSAFRLMLTLIEYMATDEYNTDLRNQNSKEVAKNLLTGFKNQVIEDLIKQGYTKDKAKEYAEAEHYLPSSFLKFI